MGRNIEIDRLRAIAVLITMTAHLSYVALDEWQWYKSLNTLWNGSTGVFVFFVISGYLICKALVPSLDSAPIKSVVLLEFWTRRFTRIMPMALLWIVIPLLLSIEFNSRGIFGSFEKNLPGAAAAAFYGFNFFVTFGGGSESIFGAYWSLSLEEQFYAVVPLFLIIVKTTRTRLAIISCYLVGILFAVGWPLYMSMRLDGLLMGAALFLLTRDRQVHGGPVPWWVGWAVTAVLLAALLLLPKYFRDWGLGKFIITYYGSVSTLLVYLACQKRGFILPLPVGLREAVDWIGTRSFGLYLIHLPAYMMASELAWRFQFFDVAPWRFCAAVCITLATTELCYRYFEMPIRRWGKGVVYPPRVLKMREAVI